MTCNRISHRLDVAACAVVFLLNFLAGCASFRQMKMPPLPQGLQASRELAAVPFFSQEKYQCGPAALAMAMSWSGLPLQPQDLIEEVYTPARKGSLQTDLIAGARRHGRIAYEIFDPESLFSQIAAGYPVVILQNLGVSWLPVWHYAVVIGYDTAQEYVILRSGTVYRKVMPFGIFEKTWARSGYWGLVILQPTQLPALPVETIYLAAVLGLENAGQYQAAASGYRTALGQWPQSLAAGMGLGNSYYALGDLKNSETAFRETIRLHPRAAPAYNNLAQILMEQRSYAEAREMALRAVSLGGSPQAVYQKTLREIESRVYHQKH